MGERKKRESGGGGEGKKVREREKESKEHRYSFTERPYSPWKLYYADLGRATSLCRSLESIHAFKLSLLTDFNYVPHAYHALIEKLPTGVIAISSVIFITRRRRGIYEYGFRAISRRGTDSLLLTRDGEKGRRKGTQELMQKLTGMYVRTRECTPALRARDTPFVPTKLRFLVKFYDVRLADAVNRRSSTRTRKISRLSRGSAQRT